MQGMDSLLGTAARRAFWLAMVLAGLSILLSFMSPVSGALGVIFWLGVSVGTRRGRWAPPLAGAALMLLELLVSAWNGAAASGIAAFAIAALFTLVCGYFFVRAALELKSEEGASRGACTWATWFVAIGLFWVCCGVYSMPTGSMEKTILQNESLVVDRLTLHLGRAPHRDDLVVFHYPVDPNQVYLKRVVAIPGDHVKLVNKQLYLNGAAVAEPWAVHSTVYMDAFRDNFPAVPPANLAPQATDMLDHHVQNGEVVVPPRTYFVLGDNRDDSLDSRYFGFVPDAEMIGRPVLIYSSYDLEGVPGSKAMATAFNTRWNRLFKFL